jgi:hypothetical protein
MTRNHECFDVESTSGSEGSFQFKAKVANYLFWLLGNCDGSYPGCSCKSPAMTQYLTRTKRNNDLVSQYLYIDRLHDSSHRMI